MSNVELIDLDALYKKYLDNCKWFDTNNDVLTAYGLAETLPRIEAEPIRRGQWIEVECYSLHGDAYSDYTCSECQHRISRPRGYTPNFCEDCGAKMEVKKK